MIGYLDRKPLKESSFDQKPDAIVSIQNPNRRSEKMHPSTSKIVMNAYIRDLELSLHPERSHRLRRRLARIRKSR